MAGEGGGIGRAAGGVRGSVGPLRTSSGAHGRCTGRMGAAALSAMRAIQPHKQRERPKAAGENGTITPACHEHYRASGDMREQEEAARNLDACYA